MPTRSFVLAALASALVLAGVLIGCAKIVPDSSYSIADRFDSYHGH